MYNNRIRNILPKTDMENARLRGHGPEQRSLERSNFMEILIACVIIVAIVALYSPMMFIRKISKLQKTLEQVEANTRKT